MKRLCQVYEDILYGVCILEIWSLVLLGSRAIPVQLGCYFWLCAQGCAQCAWGNQVVLATELRSSPCAISLARMLQYCSVLLNAAICTQGA